MVRERLKESEIDLINKQERKERGKIVDARESLDKLYDDGAIDEKEKERRLGKIEKLEGIVVLAEEDRDEYEQARKKEEELKLKVEGLMEEGKALFKELGVGGYLKAFFYPDGVAREKLKDFDEKYKQAKGDYE